MAKLKKFAARTLLNYSTQDLWNSLCGAFILRFDNGEEIETNAKETIYSSYGWDMIRRWPNTPIEPKHHVQVILGGKRLGMSTHLDLLGKIMWSVHDANLGDPTANRDALAEIVYRITNTMFNDLSHRLEEYVASLDITDFIEVLDHPTIQENKAKQIPTHESIAEAYTVLNSVMSKDDGIRDNSLVQAYRSRLVNANQVQQLIGPRGYITDIDSEEFRYPVMRGYVEGIRSFYDILIESRSAAKALQFSKSPLQEAEYFSRRLQLMTQVVQNLHMTDCKSQQYLRWTVRGKRFDDRGNETYGGDLTLLAGKHYLKEDGTLGTINKSDDHLIGKTLKLRSVLHCQHKDQYGVCATCFGEMSLSIPEGTNLGQICCTYMAQQSSQSVLSVKHLDGSSNVDPISLNAEELKFFRVSRDGMSYLLNEKLKKYPSFIVIPASAAQNLTDVTTVDDVYNLNITRVSELEQIGIITRNGDDPNYLTPLTVQVQRRKASMTHAFLNHIRKVGWDIDDKGNYKIRLEGWDWSQSILTLPLKHFNLSDHSSKYLIH